MLYANSAGDGLKDADANNMGRQKLCDAMPVPTRCHLVESDDLVMNSTASTPPPPPTAAQRRGFKSFWTTRVVLAGIELVHMLRNAQLASGPHQGAPTAAEAFYKLAA
jgi:hypothetical protein